jgi:hypothetical protein
MMRIGSLVLGVVLAASCPVAADDHPVVGLKLIIVDKMASSGTAEIIFVTKDAAVSKGAATDLGQISATLNVAYDTVFGSSAMPTGDAWRVNTATVAKYLNTDAPTAGPVRKSIIKAQKLVVVATKSLGDVPVDISAAPSGPVFVTHSVTNGEDTHRHCTQFNSCVHKLIAGGTGSRLVCRGDSVGDPTCKAQAPCGFVDLGSTVRDTCTNLEWEKKDGADASPGSGAPNPGDLNDVDNRYSWAGRCTTGFNIPCQPNAAAAATCTAQTGGGAQCDECPVGNEPCRVDPLGGGGITTVWDWLNQLNAAGFAGHGDWRLPTSAGVGLFPTGQPAEIESILDETQVGCASGTGACIDPVFGPTALGGYYTASAAGQLSDFFVQAYGGSFVSGLIFSVTTQTAHHIRAVRPSSD